jgi:hypothetical protein
VAVWVLVVLTPLLAGGCLARMCLRAATWRTRFAQLGAAIAIGGLAMAVLAWQGGGSIGAGRLSVVGASPWLAGIVVAGELATTATAWLGLVAALRWWAGHRSQPVAVRTSVVMNTVARPDVADAPRLVVVAQPNDADVDDAGKAGKLAG